MCGRRQRIGDLANLAKQRSTLVESARSSKLTIEALQLLRPKAWFISAQGNALGLWSFHSVAGHRPASSVASASWHSMRNESRLRRYGTCRLNEPRALPTAGMNDAVGVMVTSPPDNPHQPRSVNADSSLARKRAAGSISEGCANRLSACGATNLAKILPCFRQVLERG